jgi:hypothetical protein
MAKMKKGDKFVCVPCGKEIEVGIAGVCDTTLWCCGRPMKKKSQTKSKKK